MVKKNIRKDKNNFFESLNLNLFNNKSAKKSYNGILIIAGILGVLVLSGLVVGGPMADRTGATYNYTLTLYEGNTTDFIIQKHYNATNGTIAQTALGLRYTLNEGVTSRIIINFSAGASGDTNFDNLTEVNITFDKSFTVNNNFVGNFSADGGFQPASYNESVAIARTFVWMNRSANGLFGNSTGNGTFRFNISNSVPGNYNITVLLWNGTNSTAVFPVTINDTTAPDKITLNGNSTGAGSITSIYSAADIPATTSTVNLSSKSRPVTIYVSINATDFNETGAGGIGYAGQAIMSGNFSIYNGTGWINSSLVSRGTGVNVATLDYNFTSHRGSGTLQQNLTDGNYMVVVKNITDIGGNRNFTVLAYNITIDGTDPSVTVAKSATSTAHQIVLDLTVSDATSGINGKQCTTTGGGTGSITLSGTAGTQTATQAGLSCSSSYTYTVACTDHSGNTNSQSVTTSTDGCTGGSGGTSGTSGGSGDVVGSADSAFWILTYNEASTDLSDDSDGVSVNLAERYRAKVKVDTKLYYVGVVDTTDTTAKINVTTSAQDKEATLSVGDVKKFDVNADDKYDLSVTLNGVDSATGKADLSVIYIQEPVSAEEQAGVEEQAGTEAATPTTAAKSKAWIWIVVVLAVLVIAGAVFFGKRKSRFKNYGF